VAGLLPKLLGARLIFDVHDLSDDMFAMRFGDRPGRQLAQRALRSLERLAVRSADAVITVHEPYRRELIARGAPPEKVRVVMNAVHTELVPPTLREPARDAEGFRVVYHGTLTPHYGLEAVLEAAALAASEIPDLRLELYGSGDARTTLEQQAAALGIDDRVALVGAGLACRSRNTYSASSTAGNTYTRGRRLTRGTNAVEALTAASTGRLCASVSARVAWAVTSAGA